MFAPKKIHEKQSVQLSILEKPETLLQKETAEMQEKNELRRQMYERIAQGNALSEAEDRASHEWKK